MAIEYGLVLAGSTPVEQVAARAFPVADERPVGTAPLLSAALDERYGFAVTINSGTSRYVDAESDEGFWEWEPSPYVSIGFRLDKWADDMGWQVRNMLAVVRRVLDSGDEDAAFVFNGDYLLLARFGGVLTKHRREKWWKQYEGADQVLPG